MEAARRLSPRSREYLTGAKRLTEIMSWALAIFGSILYGKGLVRADVNDTMMTSYGVRCGF